MNTLAFGYILPTTGRIPDFHRLETCAAGALAKQGESKIRIPPCLYASTFAFFKLSSGYFQNFQLFLCLFLLLKISALLEMLQRLLFLFFSRWIIAMQISHRWSAYQ